MFLFFFWEVLKHIGVQGFCGVGRQIPRLEANKGLGFCWGKGFRVEGFRGFVGRGVRVSGQTPGAMGFDGLHARSIPKPYPSNP